MKGESPVKHNHLSPLVVILLSFLALIALGAFVFWLPVSTLPGKQLSFVDALFLSTSAVCVTGLSPIADLSITLSLFGKIWLAFLIQVGGLGIVTIAIYVLVIFGIKIGVTERYVVKEALNQNNLGGIVRLLKAIIMTTLTIEAVGFVLHFIVFIQDHSFFSAVGHSAFHTISAFNNAGFDILGATSIQAYSDNILFNFATMLMIVLGGLGFIVLQDIWKKKSWKHLSLFSQIVVKTSLFLIVVGWLAIKLLDYGNVTWLQALFQSVTARTAGFSTVDMSILHRSTLTIVMFLMFIGASPNSTGGGVKTTTFYTIAKSIWCFLQGKTPIVKNRRIDEVSRIKAFTITLLAMMSVFIAFVVLSRIEADNPHFDMSYLNLLFETVSAFGTVGLSLGATPHLMSASKLVVALLMFIGRLGPLTIFGVLNRNWGHPSVSNVEFPSERIIVG
jgi:trk system potassium uptake protein TrkH